MPCYKPLTGYQAPTGGKLVFAKRPNYKEKQIPCGRCLGCKIERSRQWAVRCMHELKFHEKSCFITLTYNDEHLPQGGTLVKRDWVLFMKRLRQAIAPTKIRFLQCAEYGEGNMRPHFHAIIFGYDFEDKIFYKTSPKSGSKLYRSPTLEKIWADKEGNPIGFCDIGDVTFDSAQYVAGYVTKKITGELAHDHYKYTDPETGEITHRLPEFSLMSRQPGLGKGWIEKYQTDVYPHDKVVTNGKLSKPPRYYDKHLEQTDPAQYEKIKALREEKALDHADQNPDALERQSDQQIILNQKRKDRTRSYA